MEFQIGQTVQVSLPHCHIDGEVHGIHAIHPGELLNYEIRVENAYYRFSTHELILVEQEKP